MSGLFCDKCTFDKRTPGGCACNNPGIYAQYEAMSGIGKVIRRVERLEGIVTKLTGDAEPNAELKVGPSFYAEHLMNQRDLTSIARIFAQYRYYPWIGNKPDYTQVQKANNFVCGFHEGFLEALKCINIIQNAHGESAEADLKHRLINDWIKNFKLEDE